MKTILEYVDELKEKLEMTSDAELSKYLGGHRNAVSGWRNMGQKPDDYFCIKMAELLGVNPLELIAAANLERERDPVKMEWWEDFSKRHGYKVLSVSLIVGTIALQNSELHLLLTVADGILCKPKERRSRRKQRKLICYKVSPCRNMRLFLRHAKTTESFRRVLLVRSHHRPFTL